MRMLYRLRQKNQRWRRYDRFLVQENRWRAQRYGCGGGLIDFGRGEIVGLHELIDELQEVLAADLAAEAGVAKEAREDSTGGGEEHTEGEDARGDDERGHLPRRDLDAHRSAAQGDPARPGRDLVLSLQRGRARAARHLQPRRRGPHGPQHGGSDRHRAAPPSPLRPSERSTPHSAGWLG